MLEINKIKECVQSALSEKRFAHTLGVANEAVSLAKKWNADITSAYIAGIVHDYAKEIPLQKALEKLNSFGFSMTDELKVCPALLHGPLAAYIIEKDFDIHDEDIINAVRYHTTGRRNMSLLEKIIYLADFIEPQRTFDGVDDVRALAYENLDSAVLAEANMVIVFNTEKNVFLHSDTIKARNFLIDKQTLSRDENKTLLKKVLK